jgi:chromosome segregation ATPase
MEQLKSKSHNKIAQLQHDLESRNAEVDDCKVLLKTMMAEEKLTRTRFNDIKQQLQRAEQQLQQSQATVARLQEEAVRAHSRPVSDASDTRIKTLEHELRISHEIAARLEGEKERLAMRLEDIEEQLRASARRHAEYEKTSQEQAAATAAAAAPPEPDQQLLRSFHELSDKLAIKEKILESLTEQLATEAKSAASLGAEVRALKKSQAELERRGAEADEARRAMQQELRELQEEAMEWANFEDEQDRARTTIDALKADNEKLQKQLVS